MLFNQPTSAQIHEQLHHLSTLTNRRIKKTLHKNNIKSLLQSSTFFHGHMQAQRRVIENQLHMFSLQLEQVKQDMQHQQSNVDDLTETRQEIESDFSIETSLLLSQTKAQFIIKTVHQHMHQIVQSFKKESIDIAREQSFSTLRLSIKKMGDIDLPLIQNDLSDIKTTIEQLTLIVLAPMSHKARRHYVQSFRTLLAKIGQIIAINEQQIATKSIAISYKDDAIDILDNLIIEHRMKQFGANLSYNMLMSQMYALQTIWYDTKSAELHCFETVKMCQPLLDELQQESTNLNLLFLYRCHRLKKQIDQISHHQQKSTYQQILNLSEPVSIQDIIVTHRIHSKPEHIDKLSLVLEQLSELAITAKRIRLNYKQSGHINHITRLITDEFSFYYDTPFKLDEYMQIIHHIRDISKQLPANIHFIFATFPVLDENAMLHNVAIHVSTGSTLQIHHRAKATTFSTDPDYGYPFASHSWGSESNMISLHSSAPIVFGVGSLVTCMTSGGTPFFTNIEICLDHHYAVAPFCLMKELNRLREERQIAPIQYSHVLTSNTANIIFKTPEQRITQADIIKPGTWNNTNPTEQLVSLKPIETFSFTSIDRDYFAHVFPSQPINCLPDPLFDHAVNHNLSISSAFTIKDTPPIDIFTIK